jgi:hypothetical protein
MVVVVMVVVVEAVLVPAHLPSHPFPLAGAVCAPQEEACCAPAPFPLLFQLRNSPRLATAAGMFGASHRIWAGLASAHL